MKRLTVASEHELKEKFGDDWQEHYTRAAGADLLIMYPCGRNDELVNTFEAIAKNIDVDGNVTLLEECMEKGGGGYWPTIVDMFFAAVIFVCAKGAGTFITELTKDVYKKYVHQLFETSDLKGAGKLEKARVIIRLITREGEEVTYYFAKSLSADEAYKALCIAKDHFLSIDGVKTGIPERDYIFDRQSQNWIEF